MWGHIFKQKFAYRKKFQISISKGKTFLKRRLSRPAVPLPSILIYNIPTEYIVFDNVLREPF